MKSIKFKTLLGIFFILLTISCNDLDDNLFINTIDVIKKDSELFNLLETVVNQGDDPVENTVCLDFIYPFKLFVYDANLNQIDEVILGSDIQFSEFLAQLPNDHSISISYPLETILPDGTTFSVNNNTELKIAIDSCSKEDIIGYCTGLFGDQQGTCVWEVPYIDGDDNTFAGAVFSASATGTISLYHHNETFTGTWVFLFINDKLHLNINLGGNSITVQNWNYNFKVTSFTGDTYQLETPSFSRTLTKDCLDTQTYNIGDVGPSGGIIAYDKGTFTNGWRYIEAAQNDLNIQEWGCFNGQVTDANFEQIGTGFQNSVAIANFHDNLTNYYNNPSVCSNLSNGSVSSKTALNLDINSTIDWFIPSKSELQLLYTNLHNTGLGNFTNSTYWSSSEASISTSKCINFVNGATVTLDKNTAFIKTRAIRYF